MRVKLRVLVICAACLSFGSPPVASGERAIRSAIASALTGSVELPAGVFEIRSEIRIPPGAHGLDIHGGRGGTVLRAADDFSGRAILVCQGAKNVVFRDFTVEGSRAHIGKPTGLPPSDEPFWRFYMNNGILAQDVNGLTIENVRLREISSFAVLVANSAQVRIDRITVENSGSLNSKGRNNTTGGILLEEGTHDFMVRNSVLRNIRGNGIWTHSLYHSPRNYDGVISGNQLDQLARDAVQVGHATRVRVENNQGSRIGYPPAEVDIENLAVPVGIDTAGNVDHSIYASNHFEEIDGKCIDLDGFHDGEVEGNSCVNRRQVQAYPYGHFGITLNNSNPDMQSRAIVIAKNRIDGAKYGGLFIIGSGHRVTGNDFVNLNMAHCDEKKPGCIYKANEPEMLASGIYLGSGAERSAPSSAIAIEGNRISGFRMDKHCIELAPGILRAANKISNNICSNHTTSSE